jgi:hypothetical protein
MTSLTTQLASALLALGHVPYNDAKQMSAQQVISLYHFDHFPIPRAEGGPDEHYNLVPRLIAAHREKTARIDVPQIAKNKRIAAKHLAHLERLRGK